MNRIASLIDRMVADKRLVVRSPHDLSWGDRDYCEGLFCEIFRRVDTSIVRYHHLPEYAGIIDWMTLPCGLPDTMCIRRTSTT